MITNLESAIPNNYFPSPQFFTSFVTNRADKANWQNFIAEIGAMGNV